MAEVKLTPEELNWLRRLSQGGAALMPAETARSLLEKGMVSQGLGGVVVIEAGMRYLQKHPH